MKILAIATKQSLHEINESVIRILEYLGHKVIQIDYVEVAKRFGKNNRDPILLRVFYEQKPDMILLSKGNSISPDVIKKMTKKIPLWFLLVGSYRSFRMHQEMFKFAELADLVLVGHESTFSIFQENGIKNLYYINCGHKRSTFEKKEELEMQGINEKTQQDQINYSDYAQIKVQKQHIRDLCFISITDKFEMSWPMLESIIKERKLKILETTASEMTFLDVKDQKKFIRKCSSVKIFIVEDNFISKYTSLYTKMTLSGAFIIEHQEATKENIVSLLRYYMKRQGTVIKRINEIKNELKSINREETHESHSEKKPLNDVIKDLIDIIIENQKRK